MSDKQGAILMFLMMVVAIGISIFIAGLLIQLGVY